MIEFIAFVIIWSTLYYLCLFNSGCLSKSDMNKNDIVGLVGILLLVIGLYVATIGMFFTSIIICTTGAFVILFASLTDGI